MAKLPYMKFYVSDWIGATRALASEIKGRYISLLCHIWINSKDGKIRILWDDLSVLWMCDITSASRTVTSLKLNNCISVSEFEENDLKGIEIFQRRIHRDKKAYDNQSKRQKRYRDRVTLHTTHKLRNGDAKVTPEKSEVRSQNKDSSGVSQNNTPHQPSASPPKEPKPLTEIQRVVTAWKMLTGYPKEDGGWDKLNFPRCSKSAKALIEFIGRTDDVIDCLQDVYEKLNGKGLTVTIETIVKHASDWKKDRLERRPNGVLLG